MMKGRLSLLVTLLGMPGVVATAWLAVPMLVQGTTLPVPLQALQIGAAIQGAVLVVIASILGSFLAPKVDLSAPVLSAALARRDLLAALRPQLLPGLAGGCLGAAVIIAFHRFVPSSLSFLTDREPLPLVVRVLYGGLTEEILIRWGLMTVITWGAWRLFQRNRPKPSGAIVWAAIGVSAMIFGASHVPALAPAMPTLSGVAVAYVTFANAGFGVVAGWLFWRHGLEAAIIAHVLAHVLAYLIRG